MSTAPHLSYSLPAHPRLARHLTLFNEAATFELGTRLAHGILHLHRQPAFIGLQVQLIGELGAGKTTFVRATLRGLGYAGRVRSPTYTLVEPYAFTRDSTMLTLYHFDLYRLADPREWAEGGFREYFESGAICFIEWPERASTQLGVPDLIFSLKALDNDTRTLNGYAYSERGQICLEKC